MSQVVHGTRCCSGMLWVMIVDPRNRAKFRPCFEKLCLGRLRDFGNKQHMCRCRRSLRFDFAQLLNPTWPVHCQIGRLDRLHRMQKPAAQLSCRCVLPVPLPFLGGANALATELLGADRNTGDGWCAYDRFYASLMARQLRRTLCPPMFRRVRACMCSWLDASASAQAHLCM